MTCKCDLRGANAWLGCRCGAFKYDNIPLGEAILQILDVNETWTPIPLDTNEVWTTICIELNNEILKAFMDLNPNSPAHNRK